MDLPIVTKAKEYWDDLFSDHKNVLIGILAVLLILSIIGVQFFHVIVDVVENIVDKVIVLFGKLMSGVSYNTGEILNTSSNIAFGAAKTTLDLGDGAIHDIGNVLKSQGGLVVPPVHLKQPSLYADEKTPKPTKKHKKTAHPKEEHKESKESMFSAFHIFEPMGTQLAYAPVNHDTTSLMPKMRV